MLKKKKRRRIAVLAAAGCLLAVGVTVLVLIAVGSGSSDAQVPDVVGLTYREAKKKIESAKLIAEIDPGQFVGDEKELMGKKVIAQDPGEGEQAERGTLVTLILKGVPERSTAQSSSAASAPAPVESAPPPQSTEPAQPAQTQPQAAPALIAPVEGRPVYPFTRDASIACGHWESGSQDYPYFGAPRDGNTRTHAGIDIYPPGGEGSPVKAMKEGTVIKIAPFYTRANGEVTYGVLIDHGDFVANYAELKPPQVNVGGTVRQGQVIGAVSGTVQLHFEMYDPGTTDWTSGWYGARPANLRDPTQMMTDLGL